MKILVTGGAGQLGRAVARCAVARGHEVAALSRDELDVCDDAATARQLAAIDPALVIHAAAYTAVDRAEREPERAFAVNATGAEIVARTAAAQHRAVLYVSTDYVFDGSAPRPYGEDDPVAPLGVYGASKASGERAVIAHGGTVVRTSWLFGEGGPSFVHTMLRLAAQQPVLRVVGDQRGCPTWTDDLAGALIELGELGELGQLGKLGQLGQLGRLGALAPRYHYCGAGATSWHGFAEAIVDEARRHRALACERIDPIATAEYPSAARRPASAILDTARIRALGIVPPSWRPGLARVVAQALR